MSELILLVATPAVLGFAIVVDRIYAWRSAGDAQPRERAVGNAVPPPMAAAIVGALAPA